MNSSSVPAAAVQPALGQPGQLAAKDLPRRRHHLRAVLPLEVGHQVDGGLVPRDRAKRVQVRLHHEVPVAVRPGGHLVAVHGVHVHVHGEQVVAALRHVLGHLVEEVGGRQPLALEAALHVGDGEQHRVDGALLDRLRQLVELHRAG